METKTELDFSRLWATAEFWPQIVLCLIVLFWFIALILIPFFLWGIYSQSYKQTALLKIIAEALKRRP
jgi:hypothetical protein